MKMKVVCYNLDQRTAYPIYLKLIVALLAKFKADVIILQEVASWPDVERLAAALGMHCDRGAWCSGGHTVISRWPILNMWRSLIPGSQWGNGITGIEINCGKKIWIFSTHLDDLDYKRDEALRLNETAYILSHLPKFQRAIIGGDFNSPSHLDLEKTARQLPSHLFEQAGWRDVQAGHSWTRSTWMKSQSADIDRIDRLYIMGDVTSSRGGIVDHKDLGFTRWPTGQDHRLIWNSFRPGCTP